MMLMLSSALLLLSLGTPKDPPGPYHIERVAYRGTAAFPDASVAGFAPDGTAYGFIVNPVIGEPKPVTWAPDAKCCPVQLPIPGSLFTGVISGINSWGVAVGSMSDPSDPAMPNYGRATAWFARQVYLLPEVGGPDWGDYAYDVNDAGIVFGATNRFKGIGGTDLVFWDLVSGAVYREPAVQRPIAWNDSMQVLAPGLNFVGPLGAQIGPPRIWEAGSFTELESDPRYERFSGTALNAQGDVAGSGTLPRQSGQFQRRTHAMLWDADGLTILGTAGHDIALAHGLNVHGDVVGSAHDEHVLPTGILWKEGEAYDLQDKVCGIGNAKVVSAGEILDSGRIRVLLETNGVSELVWLVPQAIPHVRCALSAGLSHRR